jgi:hypothetical protein
VTTVVLVELGTGSVTVVVGSDTVVVRLTVVVVVVEGGGPDTVSSLEHAPKEIAVPIINKIRSVFMTCYYHSSHCYGQLDACVPVRHTQT